MSDDGIEHVAVETLIGLARTAEAGGNREEALQYFNRVLELEPRLPEAWLGKGRSAGWLSTLQKLRVTETLVAFENAIGCAQDPDKPAIADRAHTDLTFILATLYHLARQHWIRFKAMSGTRASYVSTSASLLDALDTARRWGPPPQAAIEQVELIGRDLLNVGITGELHDLVTARMDAAITELRTLNPSYEPPGMAAKTYAQQQQDKADFDALGWVVLGGVILAIIVVSIALQSR